MAEKSNVIKIVAVSLVLLFLISGFSYSIYQNQQKVMNERQELSVDNSRSWSAIMGRNQGRGSATNYISDYNNENSKIQNNISFNLGNVNSSYLGEIYVPVYLVGPYVFRNLVQVFSYDSSLLKFNGTLNDVASQNISFSYSSLAPDMLEVRGNGTFEATYSTTILYYLVFTPEITRQVKTSILLDYSIVGNSTYDTQAASIINIVRGWTNLGPFNISAPEVSTGGAGTVPAIGYSPYYPNILYVASGRGGPWQANLYQGADVNGFGGVYRSTDGGKTWKQVDLGLNSTAVESINVNPYNPYEVVISTSGLTTEVGGGIYKSINGGNSWQETFPQGGNYITYINGSLYAASFHAILYSTDFGSTWHVMAPFSPIVTTLALDNNLSEIFVGLYYSDTVQIWRSSDGGSSFSEVANFPGYYTVSQIIIDPNNASRIWALVDHGYTTYPNLFRSMNGGLNWTTVNDTEVGIVYPIFSGSIAEAPQAIAYDPLNGSILYVVGPGYIYKSTDGGDHFEMIGNLDSPNTGQDNRMINVDPLNDSIIFVGSDQGLVVTYDGGKNWGDLNNRSSNMLYDVAADGPYIFTTAQDWQPLFSNDYGSTWYGTQDSEEGFVAVDPYNSSIVIHLPPFNNPLYVSNDGGASFFISDVNETALFVQPRDSPIPIAFGPNTIYIAGHNGIFYSNNSGKSFSLIPNSPGSLDPSASVLSSIVVSPSDPKILYAMEDIVTSNSGSRTLYRSDNFGFNWTVVNNVFPQSAYGVLSLAVDPFNPNTIYFASGYGHDTLYYSNNGGITYSIANISSSNMLVIPPAVYSYNLSGEELLVYVCNEGIFMSLNGGKTWMNENYNIVPSVVSSFFLSKNGSAYVSTYGSGVWYDPSLLNFTFKEYSPILTGFVPSGNYVYVDGSKYNISGYFSLALKSGINTIVYEPENEKIIINATNGSIYFINFSEIFPRLYNVTLTETGLPSGASWSITLNNITKSSTNSTIVFNEPNGTYSYTIGIYQGYSAFPYSGTVTVNGANVNVAITFTQVKYSVTFTESGLSSGTSWSVTLNGLTETSTNGTITFNEPNGTYSYVISGISGYRANTYSGTINVNGNSVSNSISWTIATYSITLMENGIPTGTAWSATLTGTTFNGQSVNVTSSSTTDTITFNEPNGSYSYIIHLPSGYQSNNAKGPVNVSGNSETATFTAQQTMNYLLVGIIAVIVIILVALGVTFLMRSKNKQKVMKQKEPPKES